MSVAAGIRLEAGVAARFRAWVAGIYVAQSRDGRSGAGFNWIPESLSFLGLGLLMLGMSVLYGKLSPKLLSQQE